MQTYLIKRFLLMIPTLFGISLVVFVIINLAPGSPAAMQPSKGEGGSTVSADQVSSMEAYKIFKKHFHLDKGILWNNYPFIKTEQVDGAVEDWVGGTAKEKIAASDALMDFGTYAVPHAVRLLERGREAGRGLKTGSPEAEANAKKLRYLIFLLAQNATVDVDKVERAKGRDFTPEQKSLNEVNKEIQADNNVLRGRVLPDDFVPGQLERLEDLWIEWFRGRPDGPSTSSTGEIEAAFEAALPTGTPKALREAGKNFGEKSGVGAANPLAEWVVGRDRDFAEATVFATAALDALFPVPEGAHEDEIENREEWLRTMKADTDPEAHPARAEHVRERWRLWRYGREEDYLDSGLDKALTFAFDTRFAHYWRNLVQLEFGESLQYQGTKVIDLITSRLKVSITFALASFLIAYIVAIPLGIFSAVFKDSVPDRFATVALFVMYSLPTFFTGVLLLQFFTIGKPLQIFPSSGFEGPQAHTFPILNYISDVAWHLVLPIVCLSLPSFAALSRYMRAGLLEVIRSDYIRTARAKGLSEYVVIFKHALRNGVIPIITMVGNILPALIGGSVIIEVIFNINGMGLLMIEAIFRRDYNVVMADSIIAGFLVLCGILVTDILYVFVDPRISFE